MDDERLVQDIKRLAAAAVAASRADPGGRDRRPGRPLLLAAMVAIALLGGVVLIGLRRGSATDIVTQPGPATAPTGSTARLSPTVAPTTSGSTAETISPLAHPDRPGTELFRHSSVDGHALLVGRLVTSPDDCTSGDADQAGFCHLLGPGTTFIIDQILDGDYVGGGSGGGTPGEGVPVVSDPSVSIAAEGAGGGGHPGDVWFHEVFATGPATALVRVDIRQADGSVVTDTMVPADGIVAFAAHQLSDFIGPARAYDAHDTLLGSATQRDPGFPIPSLPNS